MGQERKLIYSFMFILIGACTWPAVGQHGRVLCLPSERVVFSCAAKHEIASICAVSAGGILESVQYRFGRPNKIDLIYPTARDGSTKKFAYSHAVYSGGYEDHIRFESEGFTYVVFDRGLQIFTGPQPHSEFDAGIVVMRGKKKVSQLKCRDVTRMPSNIDKLLDVEGFNYDLLPD